MLFDWSLALPLPLSHTQYFRLLGTVAPKIDCNYNGNDKTSLWVSGACAAGQRQITKISSSVLDLYWTFRKGLKNPICAGWRKNSSTAQFHEAAFYVSSILWIAILKHYELCSPLATPRPKAHTNMLHVQLQSLWLNLFYSKYRKDSCLTNLMWLF